MNILEEVNAIIESGYRSKSSTKKQTNLFVNEPLMVEYFCGYHNGIDTMISLLEDLRENLGGKKAKIWRNNIYGNDYFRKI